MKVLIPDRPLRIDLVQPSLAKYRVPPFRELAQRQNVDLHLWYGENPRLPNAKPEGFAASPAELKKVRLGPRRVSYQPDQWRLAGPSATPSRDRVLMMLWDVQFATLVPALLRARRNGIATVLWGHGFGKQESPLRRSIRDRVGKMADAVLVYDEWVADGLRSRGFDPDRLFVAHNTIDVDDMHARARAVTAEQVQAFRTRTGLGEDKMLFLVSRANPERRGDLLLQAAAKLRREGHPGLRVALVGKGWAELVADDVASLGLEEAVVTPGPIYDDAELALWFAASTAVVLPEEAGLAVVHAMANGKPVVTHDALKVHAPEGRNVRHDETGLLYQRGSVDDLARQLGRLLSDDALTQRLGQAASKDVQTRLSIPNMINGHVAAAVAARQHRDARM